MKITIDIDCTPAEAREFLGLPDLSALQQEWLRQVGEQMQANVENFSPEALVKNWVSGLGGASGGADWLKAMQSAFGDAAKGGK